MHLGSVAPVINIYRYNAYGVRSPLFRYAIIPEWLSRTAKKPNRSMLSAAFQGAYRGLTEW
jgi:hypothetical protein